VPRWLGWLGIVVGALLLAASVVVLLIAEDLAGHGWASIRDAAPVPLAALVLGVALVFAGILTIRRR
jgi:hypothetical protein